MNPTVELAIYFVMFALSLYGLNALNFSKFVYPSKRSQTQVLLILLAMALAYCSVQFLFGIRY